MNAAGLLTLIVLVSVATGCTKPAPCSVGATWTWLWNGSKDLTSAHRALEAKGWESPHGDQFDLVRGSNDLSLVAAPGVGSTKGELYDPRTSGQSDAMTKLGPVTREINETLIPVWGEAIEGSLKVDPTICV